jgi:hypothetical protein
MADQSLDNSGNQDGETEGGRLRKDNDRLRQENFDLKQRFAFLESKLTLNERQKRTITRELAEDKMDLTAENILTVAKDLGYSTEQTTPETQQQNQDNSTDRQGILNRVDADGNLQTNLTPDQYRQIAMEAMMLSNSGMQTRDADGNEVTPERFKQMLAETHNDEDPKRGAARAMKIVETYGAQFGMANADLFD